MRIRLSFIVILCSLLIMWSANVRAQGKYAQGIVYENSKANPLVGATVLFMNANDRIISGTITDIDGKFKALVPEGIDKIGFSFIGMKTQKYPFQAGKNYEIILTEDNAQLEEVLVTGKAKPKGDLGMLQKNRRDMVNAVSSVDMKVLETQSVSSVEQLLQGAVPGLQVTFNSGDPGAGASIRIRGISSLEASSSPLWVIDGAEVIGDDYDVNSITNFGFSPIGDIDPSDIESIDVLKDASSTALYGSRGANGVIVIKTKRGHRGKPQFSFSTKLTATMVPKKIPMLSGNQQRIFMIEARANKLGGDDGLFFPQLRGDLDRPDAWEYNNNTDWVDLLSRTGFQQEYNFNLKGGGDRLNYYWGLSYSNEYGTTKGGGFERFTTMVNLDYRVSDKLRIGSKFSYSNTLTDKRQTEWPLYYSNRQLHPLAFARARAAFFPVYNEHETAYFREAGNPVSWSAMYNPLAMIDFSTFQTKANRFNAIINLNLDITSKLDFYTQVSVDYRQSGDEFWAPSTAMGDWPGTDIYNYGRRTDGYEMMLVNNNRLTYRPFNTDKHYLALTAVADLIYKKSSDVGIDYTGSPSPELTPAAASTRIYGMSGGTGTSSTVSVVLNAHYKLMNRYNLDVSLKTEGSSMYGKDNPFAIFPTVGVAWDMKQESFFKEKEWVDLIKPRFAYGRTGKLPSVTNLLSVTYGTGSDGYLGDSYTYIDKFAYDNIHEERTSDYNYGLDWNLFNNRFGGEFNYYNRKTTDLLLKEGMASSSGFAEQYVNFGTIKNYGWELGVNFTPIDMLEKRFRWKVYFNIARNRNRLEKLPENLIESGYSKEVEGFKSKLAVGSVIGGFYGYKALGVYATDADAVVRDFRGNVVLDTDGTPKKLRYGSAQGDAFKGGDMIYEDINHDGIINDLDIVQIGDANANYFGMFRNDLNWKQWALSFAFYYSLGQDVVNGMRRSTESMSGDDNQATSIERRWRKQGDITDMPRAEEGCERNYVASSRWVEDASYLKLKEVSLTYNFDKDLLRKMHLGQLSVWVSGMNLLTWTKYKGIDPEIGLGDITTLFGIDKQNTAPPIRCTFGLRATF